jgi:hypothetical protein
VALHDASNHDTSAPRRNKIRFPLTTTLDELVDLCGPDIYRVYALDEVGDDLGHVATISAERDRGLRNAADVEAPLLAALRGPAAARLHAPCVFSMCSAASSSVAG